MNRNEATAALRKTIGIPVYDTDGKLLAGQTFTTAAGECLISLDGATPVAASTDAVAIGRGLYYYPPSQAETNCNVAFTVILAKKARLNLATKTTTCTTKIRAQVTGENGNLVTLTWVQSGAVAAPGTLTSSTGVDPTTGQTFTNYIFTFRNAATTVANFETLIAASADLEIDVAGGAATLLTADAFAATNLAGGLRDQKCTQAITQASTPAAYAAAVWNTLVEGSYTAADLIRLSVGVLAGAVADFTTGTNVFKSLDGSKTRLTTIEAATGRTSSTPGDLT